MKYHYLKQKNGFTLIEILVVVSIIVILSLVILFSIADARRAARDMARQSVAGQLKLAVRLDKEANGSYYDGGGTNFISPTNTLGLQLMPYVQGFEGDPLAGTSGYGYYYDANFNCTQGGQKVILVRRLEKQPGNITSVCGSVTLPVGWTASRVFVEVIN